MSQINNNNNEQVQKKAEPKLVFERLEFPKVLETALADTDTFADLINNVFSAALPQFYGSKIQIVQNRRILTTIYFTDDGKHTDIEMGYDNENGPFKAITNIISPQDNKSAISRMKNYNFVHTNNSYRPKQFRLTEEGKSILSEFVPSQAINQRTGKINWDAIVHEETISDGFGNPTTVFGVTIDFTKLIRRLYDNNGGKYCYLVQIGNPITNNLTTAGGYNISQNWAMFIYRVDADDVQAIIRKFGFGSANSSGIVLCN